MVYILKGKVSWLHLVAIIWTASSDAARQACGKAAARWGNAQAVTIGPAGPRRARAPRPGRAPARASLRPGPGRRCHHLPFGTCPAVNPLPVQASKIP
jgi:hypothetical protein